jgi:hypothetical protein
VKSIADIDYFRNKEFATIRTPKQFLGFDELGVPGLGNNSSLTKLDIRYSRTVQRALNILRYGIVELCNNYLTYRGMEDKIGKFNILMRDVVSAEDSARVEDFITRMSLFDTLNNMVQGNEQYIDKAKLIWYVFHTVGIDVTEIGTKKLLSEIEKAKKGEDTESDKNPQPAAGGEDNGGGGFGGGFEGTDDDEDGGIIRG